ncbi:MAG: alpha/beta fold hydrolase, partial [Chloroflexi bacterium]|nr:alpha/beta fold hydrolase [Chloroflexota bacterium]
HPDKVNALILVNSFCLGKEIALWVRVLSASALCKSLGKAALAAIKAAKWLIYQLSIPFYLGDHLNDVKLDMGRTMTTLKGQSSVLHHQLPELSIPTLVVWGARDIIVPTSHAYVAANTIPDCQLHIFDDCGHSAYKQRIPEFSQIITRFLGRNHQSP